MKNIIFLLTTLFTLTGAHGQLNPIINLDFNCWYQMPMNCWILSWDTPSPSVTDTLVGYNIYRDDSLYLFTTNTSITYNPCSGSPDMTFAGFTYYNLGDFWIHITAVYNKAHLQSVYNDSIANDGCGLFIGIKENINYSGIHISPNPFSIETTLQTDNFFKEAILTVYNSFGQQVKQIENISGQTIILHRDNLASGLYFLRLTHDNNVILTDKLIIIVE